MVIMSSTLQIMNQISILFQDVMKIVSDIGKFMGLILVLFGIPEKITWYGVKIDIYGLSSLAITLIAMYLGFKFMSENAKWIIIIGGILVFLTTFSMFTG